MSPFFFETYPEKLIFCWNSGKFSPEADYKFINFRDSSCREVKDCAFIKTKDLQGHVLQQISEYEEDELERIGKLIIFLFISSRSFPF